ncbi:hypothetical protein C8Q78DRAFT_1038256 [Trametes maxima]|nr:hypothetical protein C8Q78DRAFT_1038256 [Trametes maxima]
MSAAAKPASLVSSPAGPSSAPHFISRTLPPPPGSILKDDYAAAEEARRRFNKRGLFSSISLPSFHRRRSKTHRGDVPSSPSSIGLADGSATTAVIPDLVVISDPPNRGEALDEDYNKDVYRWAVLYENQRGAMVFSTPYYSALTLLPLDPPPFTIPTAARSPRKYQPTVSLEDYPLPDGSWKWVSRAWMIDMHGDGQVQYDGFEYSRSFRSKKWGPDPGVMSHRGLVRRRRWIRLMMRPAPAHQEDVESVFSVPGPAALSLLPEFAHNEEGATRPPSVMITSSDDDEWPLDVWKGDSGDWDRCHAALRRLARDGRKLDLWASWLGIPDELPVLRQTSSNSSIPPALINEEPTPQRDGSDTLNVDSVSHSSDQEVDRLVADTGVSMLKASKQHVAAVVRTHGSDILALFVYPDSRATLLQYLKRVGLLEELRTGLGASESVRVLDFWSYTQDLEMDVALPSSC